MAAYQEGDVGRLCESASNKLSKYEVNMAIGSLQRIITCSFYNPHFIYFRMAAHVLGGFRYGMQRVYVLAAEANTEPKGGSYELPSSFKTSSPGSMFVWRSVISSVCSNSGLKLLLLPKSVYLSAEPPKPFPYRRAATPSIE